MKFNNPELQKIVDESEPIIKDHLQRLDRLSKDIKNLESYLSSIGISSSSNDYYIPNTANRLFYVDKRICATCSGISKPLIEHKLHFRIEMEKHLIDFVKFLLNNLGD